MDETLLIIPFVLLLAWANGANDIAKGVATLAGSGDATANHAVFWGTLWTVAGGVAAVFWGKVLITNFSNGFLASSFQIDSIFIGSTMAGASIWVLIATRLGLPISTTHALLGGLVGAVLMASGPDGLRIDAVTQKALLPLLVSPVIAVAACWLFLSLIQLLPNFKQRREKARDFEDRKTSCDKRSIWHSMHWISSAVISFARGLNDVPKIAAFLVLILTLKTPIQIQEQSNVWPIVVVAVVMGLGCLWGGFKILNVLAYQVVTLENHRGLTANVGTSLIVLAATPLGLPVSTTHVSTGSLMGVRWAHRAKPHHLDALNMILFGWVITLPIAGILAATIVWVFKFFL